MRGKPALLALKPILTTVFVLLFSVTSFSKLATKHQTNHLHFQNHLQVANLACEGTLYPNLCVSTLSTFPDLTSKTIPQLISSILNYTIKEVKQSSSNVTGLRVRTRSLKKTLEQRALEDCTNLFDTTIEELKTSISDLSQTPTTIALHNKRDCQTLLSGAMTNMYTCLDGFAYSKSNIRHKIENRLYDISKHVSNTLAMLKKVPAVKSKTSNSEAFPEYGEMKDGFPSWLTTKDRKLLQVAANQTKFNLVVAKDGTGNFTTIGDALSAAPNSSTTRFVIYIKSGAYLENVEVIRKKTNLMLVGDGIGKTVVKASRNVVDGWTTFQSATFAVVGDRFIAKGITFENSAGASKHQAVAVRSGADFSAFYQCSFVAFQDTLYVHSLRQFYRECDVYGTVDFIFGNAAVVFQNCNLYARKPDPNQKNLFTAQGREDPNQNTGISILNCKVAAAADLIPVKSTFKSYLGRPWKKYSRTVYLNSVIEDLIDPAGWLEWNGTFAFSQLTSSCSFSLSLCFLPSMETPIVDYREFFIQDTDFYNRIVLGFFLPNYFWVPLPRFCQTWLRNYIGGVLLYFISGFLWCFYIYYWKRNVFLPKDAIPSRKAMLLQISVAMKAMPWYCLLPTVSEYLTEIGWTKAFPRINNVGWVEYIGYLAIYMVIVEFGIYWVHKELHDIKPLYKYLHATHHIYNKQNTLSPFAGLAFHPLDGILQALPHSIALFIVPVHFIAHLALLFIEAVWTANIHDCIHGKLWPVMGAGYHTIHHTTYRHNYGHYTIWMDWMFGTLRDPEEDQGKAM